MKLKSLKTLILVCALVLDLVILCLAFSAGFAVGKSRCKDKAFFKLYEKNNVVVINKTYGNN